MRNAQRARNGGLRWFVAGVSGLLFAAMIAGGARAQTVFDTFANTFQLHGYLENQTIERSDTYIRDWHNASLRNRLDVQLSGTMARSLDLPGMPGASIEYFLEVRPGYEAAYDVDRDRFGNATTGFSGAGGDPRISPFSTAEGLALGAKPNATSNGFAFFPNFIQVFGNPNPANPYFVGTRFAYNPKQFQMWGPKDYTVPMPIGPKIPYLPRVGGAFWGPNVTVPLSRLRWEINDSTDADQDYPVREMYFDVRWFWHGQNWLRLGKQQIVWGKADFFRLQDTVNNVDFAQHLNVESFEDTRIPNWSATLQHRFGDIGPARDVALTGVWNFDQFTPVGLGQGGQPWATNFGQEINAFAFTGDMFEHSFNGVNNGKDAILPAGQMAKFGPHGFDMPAYNFKNMGYGAKLDWENETPQIRFALTDFIGEGDPQFKMMVPNIMASGLNPLYPNLLGPTLATALPQTYACLKSMGVNEVPWGLGTVLLPTHPKQQLGACVPKGYGGGGAQGRVQFMNTFGADGQSEIVFHKANTLGLSFDYFEPASGLVIRTESSWIHNSLITDSSSYDWTANNDILQWVVGADSQFFVRALNPDRTFFGSMQVFAHYDPGASSFGRTGATDRLSSYIFTAFVQTHYYRDQVIPVIFAAEDTKGTDAEIGGNVEWLLNDHWSAQVGFTTFLGKANQFDLTYDAPVKPGCLENPACNPPANGGTVAGLNNHNYTEQFYGATQQPLGEYRNTYDEIWTRLRYRF